MKSPSSPKKTWGPAVFFFCRRCFPVGKRGNVTPQEKWEPRGNSSEAPIVVAARKVGLTENVSGHPSHPPSQCTENTTQGLSDGTHFRRHQRSSKYVVIFRDFPCNSAWSLGWSFFMTPDWRIFFRKKNSEGEKHPIFL